MANAVSLIFWLANLDAINLGGAGKWDGGGRGGGGFWNFPKWGGGYPKRGELFLKWKGTMESLWLSFIFTLCHIELALLTTSCHWSLSVAPEKSQKTRDFLIFSEGIERDHCHEMVKVK